MNFDVFRDGLGFIEGPVWTASGELCIASISHGCVYVLDESGAVRRTIATAGGPNGLAWSLDGLFVAQNGGIFGASGITKGGVQRVRGDTVELLFAEAFTAPNDLCFGPDGRLYVTDPLTDKALVEPVLGRVVACDPGTGKWDVVIEDRLFPNGLAFDPSGEVLYLALTFPRVIERFTLRGGKLSSDGVLCTLANGRPDGIAVDQDGNLWVCTPGTGGIEVFSAEGKPLQRIEIGAGAMTTNCCFGGPENRHLFVTASGRGSVLRLEPGVAGLPLFPR